jgi:hypothetical protein
MDGICSTQVEMRHVFIILVNEMNVVSITESPCRPVGLSRVLPSKDLRWMPGISKWADSTRICRTGDCAERTRRKSALNSWRNAASNSCTSSVISFKILSSLWAIKYHTKAYEGMEAQLYTSIKGKRSSTVGQEARWAADSVRKLWRRKKSLLSLPEIKSRFVAYSARSQVGIRSELPDSILWS